MKIENENIEFDAVSSEFHILEDKEFLQETKPENYAAVYARQSINKDTFSIASQINSCINRMHKENLILYKVYSDKVSGRRVPFDERDGFSKLLNDLESGMFKTVIISRRDRLTRSMEDFMKIRKIFQRNDVKAIYASEGEFDQGNRSYISNFVENIIMAIGTLEPDNIEERTKRGRREARDKGEYNCGGTVPFGYKKENGKFEKDDNEALVVESIFSKFIHLSSVKDNGTTYKMADLIKEINDLTRDLKILKKTNNNHQENQIRTFNHQSIYGIILNPIYAGYILENAKTSLVDTIELDESNEKYKVNFEKYFIKTSNIGSIIDPPTWERAIIKRLKAKIDAPSEPQEYLFKNLIYCGACNGKVKYLEDSYCCSKGGCISINKLDLFKIITERILEDITLGRIEEIISPKIKTFSMQLTEDKKRLKLKEEKLRKHLRKYINNPDSQHFKDELLRCKEEEAILKSSINILGDKIRLLNYNLNNQEVFKLELKDFVNTNMEEQLDENWKIIDQYMKKFVNKVVLKKHTNGNGYSININYTKV